MSLVDLSDPIVQLTIVLAVSVTAHMAVAYRWAPPLAIERMKRWLKSEDGGATLGQAVTTHVVPIIEERVATVKVQEELEAFLRSPAGVTWAQELGQLAGNSAFGQIRDQMNGAKGGEVRRTTAPLIRAIISMPLESGNELLDGAWAMAPKELKRKVATQLARLIVRVGPGAVLDADWTEAGEGEEHQLALTGPDAELGYHYTDPR